MTTPQRALELADKLDKFMHEEVLTATMGDVVEAAAILRHYAEIMQAEPVMWTKLSGAGQPMFGMLKPPPKMDGSELNGLTGLIIKPKPLKRRMRCATTPKAR